MTPFWSLKSWHAGPPDAPTLLFLHGFMGSGHDWETSVAALSGHHRLLLVDLPGHGETPFLRPAEAGMIPQLADALVDLLPATGRHAIIGYSMGGRIALHCLLRHPGRFAAAVLESAGTGLVSDAERAARLAWEAALAERLTTLPLDDFLREWYALSIFASLRNQPELLARICARRRANDASQLAQALAAFSVAGQADLQPQLPSLSVPCLFLAGREDTKYAPVAERSARLCPAGESCLIENAGHVPHLEQPAEFNAAVASFLARHIDIAP